MSDETPAPDQNEAPDENTDSDGNTAPDENTAATPGESPAPEERAGDVEGASKAEPEQVYGCVVSYSHGQKVIHPTITTWYDTARLLLQDGWNVCVDVTAVDYLSFAGNRNLPDGIKPQRYEVVANFLSHERRERIRARVQVEEISAKIASIYALFPGIDYQEREVYDLMGIVFEGHPDLSRILMPETWQGHPLRKDYSTGEIPVQFSGAPGSS